MYSKTKCYVKKTFLTVKQNRRENLHSHWIKTWEILNNNNDNDNNGENQLGNANE